MATVHDEEEERMKEEDEEESDEDEWGAEVDFHVDMPGTSHDMEVVPNADPEHFEYDCLSTCQVEQRLNDAVVDVCAKLPVSPALGKALLNRHKWAVDKIIGRYKTNCHQLLVDTGLKPPHPVAATLPKHTSCPVCCRSSLSVNELKGLACGHVFCLPCWVQHCRMQLLNGISTGISCMESECNVVAPEDFVLVLLTARADLRLKYKQFAYRDYVESHPRLRICVGADCPCVIEGETGKGKRVLCKMCNSTFCFMCGHEYHAPTGCHVIRRWMVKCADDSETANYISAHTKDCPLCHSCIEKNGGCNHMQCTKCKHHFCWMCLGDWKTHGSEYYECSRYKENPAIVSEAANVKARRKLEKYLHYYERWENHNKSLKLEQQLTDKIRRRIDEKVNAHEGSWIDWQYLYEAATLLTKCRYTLQYTYPFAFYLKQGIRRDLFEYQQAQLEKEIEELSWKVERAESTDRGDLEAQMHAARRKRFVLLQDFFDETVDTSQSCVSDDEL